MSFTLGSLFDGLGGWLIASIHNNVTPIWASEIENFPIAVTKHHFPNVKHLGDARKINGAEIEPVDILCAGTPCQNLSVAGNREGLEGQESSLFYQATRILKEMRKATNGEYPKYFVWENVYGTFSSNRGYDFKAVLEEITETNIPMPKSSKWANAGMVRSSKCGVAWRVLDAQYWGVPQKRKRIFLVADFGDGRSKEIFFESEGLFGGFAESNKERKDIAEGVRESIKNSSKYIVYMNNKFGGFAETDKAQTLKASGGDIGGGSENLVQSFDTVRKLTPLECERLNGLPDNYTLIDDKSCNNTARYKALGNGMAQPCADFIISCLVR